MQSGDNTIRCIEKSIIELAREEADDYFVIAMSDANLGRYGITAKVLTAALRKSEKVKSAVSSVLSAFSSKDDLTVFLFQIIFIDRGGNEAGHVARQMPGKAYVAAEMAAIPQTLSNILTTMVGEDS